MNWFRNYDDSIDWENLVVVIFFFFIVLMFVLTILAGPATPTVDYQPQPACGEYWCK